MMRHLLFLSAFFVSTTTVAQEQTADFSRNPVLFVHGYFVVANAGEATWTDFKNQMIEDGWPKEYLFTPSFEEVQGCDPAHAMEIQAWVDNIIEKTGFEKVDIVCHSEGCLNTIWYLRFFCGVNKVRRFVGLAGAVHGTVVARLDWWSCGADEMSISLGEDGWKDNPMLVSVNECDETLGDVLYTSIWSDYDEIIRPPSGSELAGANNIEVETPMIEHGGIFLADEPYALMTDALLNGTGKNEDGPGWHCIPECAPPTPEPDPELTLEDIGTQEDVSSSEETPADGDVHDAANISDLSEEAMPDNGPTIPDWRPAESGLVAIDLGPQDIGLTETDYDTSQPDSPTQSDGCSSGTRSNTSSALIVTISIVFLLVLRRRRLFPRGWSK